MLVNKINIIKRFNIRSITKLAYVSDLHLENKKWQNSFPKINLKSLQSEVGEINGIGLLGDIGNPKKENYYAFISECAKLFENVYLLSGNHEYYTKYMATNKYKLSVKGNIERAVAKAKEVSKNNNIFYLDNNIIEVLPNKFIIGSTFWSDHTKSINSTNHIYNMFYKQITYEHHKSIHFIKTEIDKIKLKTNEANLTILSHYLPTFNLVSEKYKDLYNTNRAQSERYFSNQDELIKFPVKNWICGHSHSNMNIVLNDVNLGINCFQNNDLLIELKFVEL